jgi:high-affinity iron transporter
MFASFLIGLREGLEATLIIGILVAYLVKSDRRHLLPQVWTGVAIAVAISLAAGAALTFGPRGLSEETMEGIAGVLSIVAVALITWMIFWMARTARDLRKNLESSLDTAIALGRGAIVAMALLTVGREGLETALFVWAGIHTAGSGVGPIVGVVLGLGVAVALGWIIYRGALRINIRAFFQWTGLALIIVAAGVLAYGVHDLQEAGLLPGGGALVFDVSAQIPRDSWYGSLLRGTINFSPATTWLQAVAWISYAVPTLVGFWRISFPRRSLRPRGEPSFAVIDGSGDTPKLREHHSVASGSGA